MSKVIMIQNKYWTGAVTIFDRLFLPQVEAVDSAINDDEPKRVIEHEITEGKEKRKVKSYIMTELDKPKLPALIACVEKWELSHDFPEKPTVETFPLTPRRPSHELIEQVFDEIRKVYNGEIEIPNGSSPMPISMQSEEETAEDTTPPK